MSVKTSHATFNADVDVAIAAETALEKELGTTATKFSETVAAMEPGILQSTVVAVRKGMDMSRRQLSVEMGWTESRVWYLEQEGLRLDVERNVLDLRAELAKMNELERTGWTKPTVATAAPRTSRVVTHTEVEERAAKLVAKSVAEAVAKARAAHAEDLQALLTTAQALLDDAKARKSTTRGYAQLIESITAMQWTAE